MGNANAGGIGLLPGNQLKTRQGKRAPAVEPSPASQRSPVLENLTEMPVLGTRSQLAVVGTQLELSLALPVLLDKELENGHS